MPQHAKMKYAQIRAVAKLHEEGMTLRDISALIWERYGYKNPESCRESLGRSLRMHGFTVTRKRKWPTCSSCRGPVDQQTPGCTTCKTRIARRAYR